MCTRGHVTPRPSQRNLWVRGRRRQGARSRGGRRPHGLRLRPPTRPRRRTRPQGTQARRHVAEHEVQRGHLALRVAPAADTHGVRSVRLEHRREHIRLALPPTPRKGGGWEERVRVEVEGAGARDRGSVRVRVRGSFLRVLRECDGVAEEVAEG